MCMEMLRIMGVCHHLINPPLLPVCPLWCRLRAGGSGRLVLRWQLSLLLLKTWESQGTSSCNFRPRGRYFQFRDSNGIVTSVSQFRGIMDRRINVTRVVVVVKLHFILINYILIKWEIILWHFGKFSVFIWQISSDEKINFTHIFYLKLKSALNQLSLA